MGRASAKRKSQEGQEVRYLWTPQEGPQLLYILADWCPVVFYGGARGGGKTSGSLGDFLQGVDEHGANWHGLLVRKTYPELQEVIRQGKEMFEPLGAEWVQFHRQFRFPNGSTLTLRSIERLDDAEKLQGAQFTWICMDEATNQPDPSVFRVLLACLRWTAADVPNKRFRLTGNPGGAGHHWVKKLFIDPNPLGFQVIEDDDIPRMYIPARVDDNKILMERDPEYKDRLEHLGSPELVKAWLEGDWNVVLGAYLPDFSPRHIIAPFTIPEHWTRFRAVDWGYVDYTCVLWVAVSDGTIEGIDRGALVVYRELHVNDHTAEEVAEMVADLTTDEEEIVYTVMDPAAYGMRQKVRGRKGVTIAKVWAECGVPLKRADNDRLGGWNQLRQRLRKDSLYIFSTCTQLIKAIPLLQHSKHKPEDAQEDGWATDPCDSLRYACMSRPLVTDYKEPEVTDVLAATNWLKAHGIELTDFEKAMK